ncbi:MAG TPA: hypothetical protein VNO30_31735 [Kofleriaceae bacterium]|nr:hypothetical protein [Kofleriaceae bacterium]
MRAMRAMRAMPRALAAGPRGGRADLESGRTRAAIDGFIVPRMASVRRVHP